MITSKQFLENDRRLRQAMNQPSPFGTPAMENADRAVDGILPFQVHGAEFTKVGRKSIDWSGPQHKHQEWRAQLNRFFQLPHLAAAYEKTKDERYPQAARDYLEDWLRVHPTRPDWSIAKYDNTLNLSIRMLTWLDSLGGFLASPSFDEPFVAAMFASCESQLEYLRAHMTPVGNWRIAQSDAFLTTGLRLEGLPAAKAWVTLSVDVLNDAFHRQVLPDGVHIERNPSYHSWMTQVFQKYWRLGKARPELGLAMTPDVVARMHDYWLASMRPNGASNGLHDSGGRFTGPRPTNWSDARSAFLREAGLPDRLPETSQWFADAGQACLRDNWDENATYVTFDATTWGGGHCHLSRGAVGVHAFGRSLLVDPGSLTYEPTDPMMAHCKTTAAHNTVNINGLSQSPADPVSRFVHADGYDLATMLYEGGYWPGKYTWWWYDGFGQGEYARHHRKMLWIRGRCIVVIDDVGHPFPKGQENYMESNWQFSPGPLQIDAAARRAVTGHDDANMLLLAPLVPDNATMTVYEGSREPLRGWLAGHGAYTPAPQVCFRAADTKGWTDLVTVLIPFAGKTAPKVVATAAAPQSERGGQVDIRWPDGSRDTVYWTSRLASAIGRCDDVDSDACLLHLAHDSSGKLTKGLAVDATYVRPLTGAVRKKPETFLLG